MGSGESKVPVAESNSWSDPCSKYPLVCKNLGDLVAGMSGQEAKDNSFYLGRMENVLFCAQNYVPKELLDPKNPDHVNLAFQCGGWKKPIFAEGSVFWSVSGGLSYDIDNLRLDGSRVEYLNPNQRLVWKNRILSAYQELLQVWNRHLFKNQRRQKRNILYQRRGFLS